MPRVLLVQHKRNWVSRPCRGPRWPFSRPSGASAHLVVYTVFPIEHCLERSVQADPSIGCRNSSINGFWRAEHFDMFRDTHPVRAQLNQNPSKRMLILIVLPVLFVLKSILGCRYLSPWPRKHPGGHIFFTFLGGFCRTRYVRKTRGTHGRKGVGGGCPWSCRRWVALRRWSIPWFCFWFLLPTVFCLLIGVGDMAVEDGGGWLVV